MAGLLLLAAGGCGSDPSAAYRDAAASAVQGTLSEARSAELAGRLWLSGRSTRAFATVVVRDSDAGVGSDAAWFEGQQPPLRVDDAVRRRTVDALDAAGAAVQDLRISLDRGDRPATRAAVGRLRSACADLAALEEVLS